jgi:PKD repeat protein
MMRATGSDRARAGRRHALTALVVVLMVTGGLGVLTLAATPTGAPSPPAGSSGVVPFTENIDHKSSQTCSTLGVGTCSTTVATTAYSTVLIILLAATSTASGTCGTLSGASAGLVFTGVGPVTQLSNQGAGTASSCAEGFYSANVSASASRTVYGNETAADAFLLTLLAFDIGNATVLSPLDCSQTTNKSSATATLTFSSCRPANGGEFAILAATDFAYNTTGGGAGNYMAFSPSGGLPVLVTPQIITSTAGGLFIGQESVSFGESMAGTPILSESEAAYYKTASANKNNTLTASFEHAWTALGVVFKAAPLPSSGVVFNFDPYKWSTSFVVWNWTDSSGWPYFNGTIFRAPDTAGTCGVFAHPFSTGALASGRIQSVNDTAVAAGYWCFELFLWNTTGESPVEVIYHGLLLSSNFGDSFTFSPVQPEAGLAITFTSATSNSVGTVTYAWAFGDSTTSSVANPTKTYVSPGTYTCYENDTDGAGRVASASQLIVVVAAVADSFTTSPATLEATAVTTFSSAVTGGVSPFTYAWAFGDGGTSTLANPTHTYASSGSPVAYENVTDANGVVASVHHTFTVVAAVADSFTSSPASPEALSAVSFTSNVTHGVSPFSYSWVFGDGGGAITANPAHTYISGGTFVPYLNVTDADGVVASFHASITVAAAVGVTISVLPSVPEVSHSAAFTSTVTGGAAAFTYAWRFGDGGSSALANPHHTYSSPGPENVTLNVTDANGAISRTSLDLYVVNTPTVSFSFLPTSAGIGANVVFTSHVSNGTAPFTYSWAFGDGSFGTSADPTHAYAGSGNRTIWLNVTDSFGSIASFHANLTVVISLTGGFVFDPASPYVLESVVFVPSVQGGAGPYTYLWTFVNFTTSHNQTPSYAWGQVGTFLVNLVITDTRGSHVNVTETVGVSPAPAVQVAVQIPWDSLIFISFIISGFWAVFTVFSYWRKSRERRRLRVPVPRGGTQSPAGRR